MHVVSWFGPTRCYLPASYVWGSLKDPVRAWPRGGGGIAVVGAKLARLELATPALQMRANQGMQLILKSAT